MHDLKITPKYYDAVYNGAKTFEVRKADRPYRVGDTLWLREYDPEKPKYTNRRLKAVITYILTAEDFPEAIAPEYIIIGMRLL